MDQKQKKIGLFSKIESREDAIKIANESATGFFVVAAIQGGIGAFFAPSLIIDAVLFAILAATLRAWKSRIAAILLFLLSLIIVVTTILTKLGIAQAGGSNIILAFIVVWAAIRALQATFLLHGRFAESKDSSAQN